jgi:hypothetical protein
MLMMVRPLSLRTRRTKKSEGGGRYRRQCASTSCSTCRTSPGTSLSSSGTPAGSRGHCSRRPSCTRHNRCTPTRSSRVCPSAAPGSIRSRCRHPGPRGPPRVHRPDLARSTSLPWPERKWAGPAGRLQHGRTAPTTRTTLTMPTNGAQLEELCTHHHGQKGQKRHTLRRQCSASEGQRTGGLDGVVGQVDVHLLLRRRIVSRR